MVNPRYSTIDTFLLIFIFALPSSFQITPPAIPIGHFYITLVEFAIFVLLCNWALNLLSSGKGYRSPLDPLVIVFLIYLAFSLFLGAGRFGAGKALADFRNYLPIFLYFWAIRFYGYSDDLSSVRQKIFKILLLVATYILILFLFFRGVLSTSDRMTERVFFDNTLFLLFIYGGYLLAKAIETKKDNFYIFLILLSNLLMLLVMQARTYWVAFALTIAIAVFWQKKKLFKSRFVMTTAIFMITTVFGVSLFLSIVPAEKLGIQGLVTSISERIDSLVNIEATLFERSNETQTDVETVGARLMTAEIVWDDYIRREPLFGTGLGGEMPMVSRLGGIVMWKYHIDNGYLTILAKFGLTGFLLYALIMWKTCRTLYTIAFSPLTGMNDRILARSFLAGIAAILLASFFSSIFIRQQPSLMAFLFMLAETEGLRRRFESRR